jgi:hypothetical protein
MKQGGNRSTQTTSPVGMLAGSQTLSTGVSSGGEASALESNIEGVSPPVSAVDGTSELTSADASALVAGRPADVPHPDSIRIKSATLRNDKLFMHAFRLANDIAVQRQTRTDAASVAWPREGAGAARAVAASQDLRT